MQEERPTVEKSSSIEISTDQCEVVSLKNQKLFMSVLMKYYLKDSLRQKISDLQNKNVQIQSERNKIELELHTNERDMAASNMTDQRVIVSD